MARTRSVADQLVGQLVAAGVRHIYGIVGDSLRERSSRRPLRNSGWLCVRRTCCVGPGPIRTSLARF